MLNQVKVSQLVPILDTVKYLGLIARYLGQVLDPNLLYKLLFKATIRSCHSIRCLNTQTSRIP